MKKSIHFSIIAVLTTLFAFSDIYGLAKKGNDDKQDWVDYTGWMPHPDQAPENRTEDQLNERMKLNRERYENAIKDLNNVNCEELKKASTFYEEIIKDANKSGKYSLAGDAAKRMTVTTEAALSKYCTPKAADEEPADVPAGDGQAAGEAQQDDDSGPVVPAPEPADDIPVNKHKSAFFALNLAFLAKKGRG